MNGTHSALSTVVRDPSSETARDYRVATVVVTTVPDKTRDPPRPLDSDLLPFTVPPLSENSRSPHGGIGAHPPQTATVTHNPLNTPHTRSDPHPLSRLHNSVRDPNKLTYTCSKH